MILGERLGVLKRLPICKQIDKLSNIIGGIQHQLAGYHFHAVHRIVKSLIGDHQLELVELEWIWLNQ